MLETQLQTQDSERRLKLLVGLKFSVILYTVLAHIQFALLPHSIKEQVSILLMSTLNKSSKISKKNQEAVEFLLEWEIAWLHLLNFSQSSLHPLYLAA